MLDAIRNRKSVRFFKNDSVDRAVIDDIVAAGFHAPSGHNNKGWHAIIVDDKEVLEELSKMHKWSKMIKNAPYLIVVCYDTSDLGTFWVEDSSAFMENMLIQATAYNLGSCWIGVHGLIVDDLIVEEKIRDTFDIPLGIEILGMCCIGYTAKEFNFSKELDIKERLHNNKF